MKEIILDTETTGLSVRDGHRIVEIGCIELNDLIPTQNSFHCYLNPERKVSEKALEVHGYTDEFLSTQKKFSEVVDEFLNFIENKRLVIHNAEFDLSHLNNELTLLGKKKLNTENSIDTLALARDKFPGSPISLDALCKRYRVDNSKRTQHTALIELSTRYLLHKASRLNGEPGNLSLAKARVSTALSLSNFFFPNNASSLFKCDRSNSAL